MASGFVGPFLHGVFFITDLVTSVYDLIFVDVGSTGIGGKFKFLTVWNICLQTAYFGLSFLTDLVEGEKAPGEKRGTLQRWRDSLHSTLIFPCSTFVTMTFWGIYAVDRELVFPKKLDAFIPSWLNHLLHSTIFLFILVDKFVSFHRHPKKHNGILAIIGFTSLYLSWIFFIAWYDDFWVYPILKVLAPHERAIFISMCMCLFASLFILGEQITNFIWRKEISAANRQQSISTGSSLKED